MKQRQLRLGDILDDYCPRERRVTNHAVVAMIGPDVKQTRCTTCDAEHAYKHARLPRQRRKSDPPPALHSQVLAGGPKRVMHEPAANAESADASVAPGADAAPVPVDDNQPAPQAAQESANSDDVMDKDNTTEPAAGSDDEFEGPVHRPLIRATLPRQEGQPLPARPAPDFTIRQPGGRPDRFRPRHPRGGQQFHGNRSNGNMPGGPTRGGMPRHDSGRPPRPPMTSRLAQRHGPGRKRSK